MNTFFSFMGVLFELMTFKSLFFALLLLGKILDDLFLLGLQTLFAALASLAGL